MVAISLYRGNLHRVSDVPRRWPMPPRTLSLRHFKILLHNRALALSLLQGTAPIPHKEDKAKAKIEKDEEEKKGEEEEEGMGDNGCCTRPPSLSRYREEEPMTARRDAETPIEEPKSNAIDASSGSPRVGRKDLGMEKASDAEEGLGGGADQVKMEVCQNQKIATNKSGRKKELEGKLHVLNDKKHHLVQMLKQHHVREAN